MGWAGADENDPDPTGGQRRQRKEGRDRRVAGEEFGREPRLESGSSLSGNQGAQVGEVWSEGKEYIEKERSDSGQASSGLSINASQLFSLASSLFSPPLLHSLLTVFFLVSPPSIFSPSSLVPPFSIFLPFSPISPPFLFPQHQHQTPTSSRPTSKTNRTISSNSSPLSTPTSQSSSQSQVSDHGNSTGRQLRSSTRSNDTGPAASIHPTPPDTQDTICLSQAALRAATEHMQPTPNPPNSNPNPPDFDINTVLRALTAAFEAQRGPDPANTSNTTASTSTTAELPGNDPMLLSIQDMFPAIDMAVVQSIYTNKFRAENLLKLEASFTYKKKRPQFYSFGGGEASLNIATTSKDIELEEYESISHLMPPFIVYMVIIVTFAPPPQKLPVAFVLMSYQHTLYDLLRTHTWDSLRKFHVVFHQKRICLAVYEPRGWSTRDHGLETAQLFKRSTTDGT
ncbi:hypothetical protein K440DRAFT_678852 [Wilcoxina mikolae CBS 423.85]|nr:hypothetical protein K440DRAFT_678852 [Wilcoxina mikolae CBS 423.85]